MATVTDTPVVDAEISPDLSESLYEVIDGQIVEKTMGAFELQIASRLHGSLWAFVDEHGLGTSEVEMIFLIDEARCLKLRPDVAFVSRERWPIDEPAPEREAWNVIPDLAVEVVSPSNSAADMAEKVNDYFRAGVRLVWLFYPRLQIVYVYESASRMTILHVGDVLDGGDVVPGFRLPLSAIYRPRAKDKS